MRVILEANISCCYVISKFDLNFCKDVTCKDSTKYRLMPLAFGEIKWKYILYKFKIKFYVDL